MTKYSHTSKEHFGANEVNGNDFGFLFFQAQLCLLACLQDSLTSQE